MRVALIAVVAGVAAMPADRPLVNLRAFARLYGYVKYFHPSDEASAVDWDAMAVYGVGRVKNARTAAELKSALEEVFLPVAPTLQITMAGEKPAVVKPTATQGLKVVTWQHLGHGFTPNYASTYRSKRINRVVEVVSGLPSGTVTQKVDASSHRGRRVRMRAWVRAELAGPADRAQLFLRVDRPHGGGFADSMDDRPITSREWATYEIEGEVAPDATAIAFGCRLKGVGKVWVDGFSLDAGVNAVPLTNPGFEKGSTEGWQASEGYSATVVQDRPREGKYALLLATVTRRLEENLFAEHPQVGESIDKDLGDGLRVHVPLALWSDSKRTLGSPRLPLEGLQTRLAALPSHDPKQEDVRLGAVVAAWNVLEHFYPYFDVVGTDWQVVLDETLVDALDDRAPEDLTRTLERLIERLRDGHGRVTPPPSLGRRAVLPWRVELVEGSVVVTASSDPALRRGDLVIEVDGHDSLALLRAAEGRVSGSPAWKRFRGLGLIGVGDEGSKARIVLERDGRRLAVEAARGTPEVPPEFERPAVQELAGGIWYVDLDRADANEIQDRLPAIAEAPGVVFDLRGYPGDHEVLSHLLSVPDTSSGWMQVPRIIYPDHERIAGWTRDGWLLPVKAPHIRGRVAFVTGGMAISYAESFLSFVEHYRLGEIVGGPTAGANGNVSFLELPGGFRIFWTGMRVVKHDGSMHHGVGIRPTVPAERTLKGVREGRDELLERALAALAIP